MKKYLFILLVFVCVLPYLKAETVIDKISFVNNSNYSEKQLKAVI